MQRQRKQGEVQSQFEALSVSRLGVENKTCSRRVSAPNLRRRNPSLKAELRLGCGEAAVHPQPDRACKGKPGKHERASRNLFSFS